MIIQCQGCAAKYFLPEDKVPENPIKVRCPKCKAVFTLVPRVEPVAAGSVPADTATARRADRAPERTPQEAAADAAVSPSSESIPSPEPSVESPRRGKRLPEDRAKRLARVLVSDILCYNRDKRDRALNDGSLMTALGEEIKKSWELYKEKVGAEVANSTNYFKEALNEILADGQEIF